MGSMLSVVPGALVMFARQQNREVKWLAKKQQLGARLLTPSLVLPATPLSYLAHIEVYFLIAETKFSQQQSG